MSIEKRLQPYEDAPVIEEADKKKRQQQTGGCRHQLSKTWGHVAIEKSLDIATHKAAGHAIKAAEDICGEVHSDGIHAQPYERAAPFLILPHIDDQIKRGQQQRAVSTGDQ